jgi:hypothetical protein
VPGGLKNTARSCSQHGVVADGLNSERLGSVMLLSQNVYSIGSTCKTFDVARAPPKILIFPLESPCVR